MYSTKLTSLVLWLIALVQIEQKKLASEWYLTLLQVPRLHCIVHRKLATRDFLTGSPTLEVTKSCFDYLCSLFHLPYYVFLDLSAYFGHLSSEIVNIQPKSSLVKGVRESLLGHLTSVLGNDGLAAHFMLLHLLSGVGGFSYNVDISNRHCYTIQDNFSEVLDYQLNI